ncbi:lysine 2,3-aminomutase [Sphaerochaeta pleomorpha str. Grapes]|uniref:Lysine 2,3-aminomutase n=1 Tax=Sphaerochaeta pleomorpha (strain ATCC BAA-1885 / DSM 22778 / Grapes) TaxID=158190 RepID=G8QXI7_SPHPG|nr:lysine 2,3-aminomutase [Sphaerochaeta pleomorpha]AEV29550.1 lysine 2,3-aminomutase [Sphaerochaeta pleomorpha str. Grapes]
METQLERIAKLVAMIRADESTIGSLFLDEKLSLEALVEKLKTHYSEVMQKEHPNAWSYYTGEVHDEQSFYKLTGTSLAFLRIMDYLDHEGCSFSDGNLHGEGVVSQPLAILRSLVRGEDISVSPDFVEDMYHLLRQLKGIDHKEVPSRSQVQAWMERHPSGLDKEVIAWRAKNKEYIVQLLIKRIRSEHKSSQFYQLKGSMDAAQARKQVLTWWRDDRFQLKYAIRSSSELNRYLQNSLDKETLEQMETAEKKGIPIFATPYFLSLIDVRPLSEQEHPHSDAVLRDYLFYSKDLVEEFGSIVAWEKEDIVEEGKPNAAGWILPSHNIHRRYPNVAIFIPDTMGRACGGLCAYCQRMYDFQRGRFNFELEKLRPKRNWSTMLALNMDYFRKDPYLSDILITGGDAFMSSVSSLRNILDAVLKMAQEKLLDNEERAEGEKYATMKRVRLGTKLPVYLPQRITKELVSVLAQFKEKASLVGISQCIVQIHISSSMEVTPDTKKAIAAILSAGWAVTNQEVFTISASRRGHSAKLRKTLNEIGVLPYYTFTVKGFKENRHVFANNCRSTQEQIEESSIGRVALRYHSIIRPFISDAPHMLENIDSIRKSDEIPFLSTDRNTLNLPGVGKSNTYRTIGITSDGRRILEFEFDHTRPHSPVIEEMGSVIVIESKSIAEYLRQLGQMGEDVSEYETIWGYSAGSLEPRSSVFEGMMK